MLNCYSGPACPWHLGCRMTPYQWDSTEANRVNAQERKHLHQSFPPARPHIPLAPPVWNSATSGLCITCFGFATGQAGLQYKMPCTTAPSFPAHPTHPPVPNPYTNARVPFNNLTNNTQGCNVSPPCKKSPCIIFNCCDDVYSGDMNVHAEKRAHVCEVVSVNANEPVDDISLISSQARRLESTQCVATFG